MQEPTRAADLLLRIAKFVCAFTIRWSGLGWLVSKTVARRRVGILAYHDPRPEVFARHLRYLTKRYSFIALDTLVDALHTGNWSKIPNYALVLTFDDGYHGCAALAPLFEAFGIVPTFYVCSQVAGTHRRFWWSPAGRDADGLKPLDNAERERILSERYGFAQLDEHPSPEALTKDQIASLRERVDFESHSRFHPVLTLLSDAECQAEIDASRVEVERLAESRCEHFAYPNGDYGEREIALARDAGYRSARTVDAGWNSPRTNPFRLKVLGVSDEASVTQLAANLAGGLFLKRLLQGSLRGRHVPVRRPRRALELPPPLPEASPTRAHP